MAKTAQNQTPALQAILAQYEANKPKEKVETKKFEKGEILKKYFNPFLPQGVKSGEFSFRILPTTDGSSPFVEAYFHSIKVNNKWEKIYCPNKNNEEDCPICEAETALKSSGSKEDFELSKTYRASKFYIVKGIDRAKPEDGVKFWRFKHNYKQQGAFDKIIPIFAKKGDVTDAIAGYDLTIMVGRDDKNNSVITSVMPDEKSRLSDDDAQMKTWLDDDTTWTDVFKKKDTDFLQAVVEGRAPYWDDSTKKYVTPGKESKGTAKSVSVNPVTAKVAGKDFTGMEVDDSDLPF